MSKNIKILIYLLFFNLKMQLYGYWGQHYVSYVTHVVIGASIKSLCSSIWGKIGIVTQKQRKDEKEKHKKRMEVIVETAKRDVSNELAAVRTEVSKEVTDLGQACDGFVNTANNTKECAQRITEEFSTNITALEGLTMDCVESERRDLCKKIEDFQTSFNCFLDTKLGGIIKNLNERQKQEDAAKIQYIDLIGQTATTLEALKQFKIKMESQENCSLLIQGKIEALQTEISKKSSTVEEQKKILIKCILQLNFMQKKLQEKNKKETVTTAKIGHVNDVALDQTFDQVNKKKSDIEVKEVVRIRDIIPWVPFIDDKSKDMGRENLLIKRRIRAMGMIGNTKNSLGIK